MKATIDIDELLCDLGTPAILGPANIWEGWVLYLPLEEPIICDSFEEAAQEMRKFLSPKVKTRKRKS